MDILNILGAIQKGLTFVNSLEPVAASLGGETVDKATQIAGLVGDVLSNVQKRVEEGAIVASSSDQDQIRRLAEALDATNAKLAGIIDAS